MGRQGWAMAESGIALVAALALLLTVSPLGVTGVESQVTALDEPVTAPASTDAPAEVSYPYDKWATEAQSLAKLLPPPPQQPSAHNLQSETQRWALKKGLKVKHLDARTEYDGYVQKAQKEKAEAAEKDEAREIKVKAIARAAQKEKAQAQLNELSNPSKSQDANQLAAGAQEIRTKEILDADTSPSRLVLLQETSAKSNASSASTVVESSGEIAMKSKGNTTETEGVSVIKTSKKGNTEAPIHSDSDTEPAKKSKKTPGVKKGDSDAEPAKKSKKTPGVKKG